MMEWEKPIEANIGKSLKSFVVSNYKDLQVLEGSQISRFKSEIRGL